MMEHDLISRSGLLARIGDLVSDPEDDTIFVTMRQACTAAHQCISEMVTAAPAVNAVVVPCRIGDEVWAVQKFHGKVWRARKNVVSQMWFTEDMRILIVVKNTLRGFWGDRVFATQEEAEAEVKRRVEDGR